MKGNVMVKMDKSEIRTVDSLNAYRKSLPNRFSVIESYLKEAMDLLRDRHKELKTAMFNEMDQEPDSMAQDDIAENHIDDILMFQRDYVEILTSSTFVSTFSLFESKMLRICELTQGALNSNLSVKDLNGSGILERSRKFLEKVVEIELNSMNFEWQEIKSHSKIRNLIVHNSSNLKQDSTKPLNEQMMYPYISANPYLKMPILNRGYFYIHDHQFILNFNSKAESFLTAVLDRIVEKIDK